MSQPLRLIEGSIALGRVCSRVFGLALVMAAAGLWLLPASTFDPDLMLIKMGLSISALCAGLGFLQVGLSPPQPDVQVDTATRRVRIVEWTALHNPIVLKECDFEDLSHVERDGCLLRFWDREGEFLAEICVPDKQAIDRILSHLRDAMGKA